LLIGDVASVDVLHHEIMDAQTVEETSFDKQREKKFIENFSFSKIQLLVNHREKII